ncbi:hypothetical protein CDL15_Pgr017293 [Punica granatum]|uniref:Uncharacterized protein n=1 Tax=Punica granatum TaxID=22663 RepID=A0A218Y254_PUNGR|nr:hypothetical protein CDL15_Pgr017293 [Punica granatum]
MTILQDTCHRPFQQMKIGAPPPNIQSRATLVTPSQGHNFVLFFYLDNRGKTYVKFVRKKRRSIRLPNAQDMFQDSDLTDETGQGHIQSPRGDAIQSTCGNEKVRKSKSKGHKQTDVAEDLVSRYLEKNRFRDP